MKYLPVLMIFTSYLILLFILVDHLNIQTV